MEQYVRVAGLNDDGTTYTESMPVLMAGQLLALHAKLIDQWRKDHPLPTERPSNG